ncbi:MAG: hypothetical protein J1E36_00700 [Eubacterium sp.]|nr:hypothetical protein [Eubacterium sp.]
MLGYIDRSYSHHLAVKVEKKKISNPIRKKIASDFTLSKEQKDKIDKLFLDNYGKKVPYDWHQYYSSFSGCFDENYIPELLFIPEIQRKFVPTEYAKVFTNKNLLPVLIGGVDNVRTANIIISCENGVLRNSEMEFIDYEQAEKVLFNIGKVFLKPTTESNSGKGCAVLDLKDGIDQKSGKSVKEILNNQGKHYNVQELLINCKSIRDLHPQSINTFRIVTYIWKNKIFHFPVLFRIAQGKSSLDNVHQGSLFIGVDDDGTLKKCAFTERGDRYDEHPDSKIKFDGYNIQQVPEMINAVKKLHKRIPQVGMISWDVTVDENNTIVIVELNIQAQSVRAVQIANGKGAFGENTAEILRWISKKQ